MANAAEFEQIKRGVQMLANTHNRRLDGETTLAWARSLERNTGPRLWKVLGEALEGDSMPSLKELVARSRPEDYRKPGDTQAPPPQTDAYRRKIDLEKVLSLLFISYTQPQNTWFLDAFNGGTMERLFGGTLAESIAKAKTHYSKETVVDWAEARFRKIDADDRAMGIRARF